MICTDTDNYVNVVNYKERKEKKDFFASLI